MTDTITLVEALPQSLLRAGQYNKTDQCPPAAILWPDKERQWEPLLPALRERLPLDKQPVDGEPDLNDGVRLNIRPFVTAGVLRGRFTINWSKDRGTNPDGSKRINDRHLTRAEKAAARTN